MWPLPPYPHQFCMVALHLQSSSVCSAAEGLLQRTAWALHLFTRRIFCETHRPITSGRQNDIACQTENMPLFIVYSAVILRAIWRPSREFWLVSIDVLPNIRNLAFVRLDVTKNTFLCGQTNDLGWVHTSLPQMTGLITRSLLRF